MLRLLLRTLTLLWASFLALYLELCLIRWVGSEIRIFAYCKNLVLLATFLVAIEFQSTYLYAYQVDQQREAEIREIARKMGVDPEFLLHPEGRKSFDFHAFEVPLT